MGRISYTSNMFSLKLVLCVCIFFGIEAEPKPKPKAEPKPQPKAEPKPYSPFWYPQYNRAGFQFTGRETKCTRGAKACFELERELRHQCNRHLVWNMCNWFEWSELYVDGQPEFFCCNGLANNAKFPALQERTYECFCLPNVPG